MGIMVQVGLFWDKMSKPLTLQEVKDRIFKAHGGTVSIDEATYRNASSFARFIDKEFGEWWAQAHHVAMGHKHIKRGYLERKMHIIPIAEVKRRLLEIHNGIIIVDETTYKSMHIKARFIDKEFGEWWSTPANVLEGHKHELRSRIEAASKRSKTRKAKIASGEIDKWIWLKQSKFEHTDIEIALENELKKRNINFETQKVLFNKFMPDLVNEAHKIIIFADGCYWHGCKEHNTGFKKASQRQSIDKSQTIYLTRCGYKVFRFWEHEIKADVKVCVNKIENYIKGLL